MARKPQRVKKPKDVVVDTRIWAVEILDEKGVHIATETESSERMARWRLAHVLKKIENLDYAEEVKGARLMCDGNPVT